MNELHLAKDYNCHQQTSCMQYMGIVYLQELAKPSRNDLLCY